MSSIKENEIQTIQSSITMIVLLISFSMLFGTLFMGYMVYRVRSAQWPPMGMNDVGLFYPSVSTAVIFFSSLAYMRFEKLFKIDTSSRGKNYLRLSLVFGFMFCVSQWFVWNDLAIRGITQGSGIFGSMIYGFTWIHIAHVVIGILLLLWLSFRFKNFSTNKFKNQIRVRNVGMFWHFLGVIWFLMYLILFVF